MTTTTSYRLTHDAQGMPCYVAAYCDDHPSIPWADVTTIRCSECGRRLTVHHRPDVALVGLWPHHTSELVAANDVEQPSSRV